jgi:hypothetical protein
MPQSVEVERILTFIGSPDKPNARASAIKGRILPCDAYTTFVGVYPVEGKFNDVLGYGTQMFATTERTLSPRNLAKTICELSIPESSEQPIAPSLLSSFQTQFEIAAARMHQPIAVVAMNGPEIATLFYIDSMSAPDALKQMQQFAFIDPPKYSEDAIMREALGASRLVFDSIQVQG